MTRIQDVANAIKARKADHSGQLTVAIAGPPASGKSTLAADLLMSLNDAMIIGMDGFHLDNGVLADRDLSERKGSPESFDVAGFASLLGRLSSGEEVLAPIFDRELDLSRAGAVAVSPDHDIVIVEGNYLLLDEDPWRDLHGFWDMTIMIDAPLEILKERLIHRWLSLGLGVEKAHAKAAKNDLPNAERVLSGSLKAELLVGNIDP